MTPEIVNVEQAEAWDGPDGEFWAAHQARFDTTISPHHAQLMATAAIAPGERVLDIGCGNGRTTRDAARATGAGGEVLAVDLSGPMLTKAAQLAKDEGLGNVRFEHGDAQVHPFPRGAFDLALSRFGVMFFADPVAAFTNIASALRPGGRLTMAVWGPVPRNEWITAMLDAVAAVRELPKPPPDAPGPFSLADQSRAEGILSRAGFTDIAFAPSEHPFRLGDDADDAFGFVTQLHVFQQLLEDLDDETRAQPLDHLRATIAAHETPDGVIFRSLAWVMTARKP
jgi:SAM-dependent methyltransferase